MRKKYLGCVLKNYTFCNTPTNANIFQVFEKGVEIDNESTINGNIYLSRNMNGCCIQDQPSDRTETLNLESSLQLLKCGNETVRLKSNRVMSTFAYYMICCLSDIFQVTR